MRRILTIVLFAMIAAATAAVPAWALPSVPASAWETSAICNGCHSDFVARWSLSMHAQALSDPVYRYKIAQAERETSGAVTPFCTKCHGPIATMAGEIEGTDLSGLSPQGAQAVSCEFCHHVTAANEDTPGAMPGNTSQVIDPGTGARNTKHGQLSDSVSVWHPTQYNAVFDTGEFCGACHDVRHPGNGLLLEGTYTEWKASSYAASGITCQKCHMTPAVGVPVGPGIAAPGAPVRPLLYIMNWVGGNAVFGPADEAVKRLQSAARVTLTAPTAAPAGGATKVTVKIDNVGAGHYIPTGLTEVRQMWISVVATDSAGNVVMNQRRDFGTVLEDEHGTFPVEVWDATAVHSDDRIPPNGSVESSWTFTFPTSGAVNVGATLYYRSFDPALAAAAGVTQTVPTISMASTRTAIASAVKPTPTLSNPVAPATMSHTRSYTVYATLKPRHAAGSYPVRIYKYRLVSRKWRSYGYVRAKATNYSTYTKASVRLKLTTRGKWRLRAYAPADSAHSAKWSSRYDYVTVK